jgi:hypothetical protein
VEFENAPGCSMMKTYLKDVKNVSKNYKPDKFNGTISKMLKSMCDVKYLLENVFDKPRSSKSLVELCRSIPKVDINLQAAIFKYK